MFSLAVAEDLNYGHCPFPEDPEVKERVIGQVSSMTWITAKIMNVKESRLEQMYPIVDHFIIA